jgi:cytoskeletal protein CcmA (bactofilin family)
MFGRRGDEPGGGNRNGDNGAPEQRPAGPRPAAGPSGGPPEQRPPGPRPGPGHGGPAEQRPAGPRPGPSYAGIASPGAQPAAGTGVSPFADGIRVDSARRRPVGPAEAPTGEAPAAPEPQAPVRHDQPLPAVPPSAGGAHRAAVYRTAPEPPAPTAAPQAVASREGGQTMPETDESRKLTVGKGISLKGEISNCDTLVIEGNVEASLSDCRSLVVGESGVIVGTVMVEEATVAGRFKGKLTVAGVLSIKSGGQVRGEIRYGALQVESGGVLAGSTATSADPDEDGGEDAPRPAAPAGAGTFGMRTSTPGAHD